MGGPIDGSAREEGKSKGEGISQREFLGLGLYILVSVVFNLLCMWVV